MGKLLTPILRSIIHPLVVSDKGDVLTRFPLGPPPLTVFDFTAATLPSGATLTRASSGTRTNISGVVVSETTDVARFDYDASNALRGLLVEPAATNLLYPSNVSNYGAILVTPTETQADPFGTTTAVLFGANFGTASKYVEIPASGNITVASGSSYAMSYFIKPGTTSLIQTIPSGGGGFVNATTYVNYDLTGAGSVATQGATAAGTVAKVTSDFYRAALVSTSNANNTTQNLVPWFIDSGSAGRAAASSTTGNVTIAGAQFELGAKATSYIPTTSGAATRAADVLTLSGAANGSSDWRYTFDDLSTQDVSTTVSGGSFVAPTNLNRSRIRRIEKI